MILLLVGLWLGLVVGALALWRWARVVPPSTRQRLERTIIITNRRRDYELQARAIRREAMRWRRQLFNELHSREP